MPKKKPKKASETDDQPSLPLTSSESAPESANDGSMALHAGEPAPEAVDLGAEPLPTPAAPVPQDDQAPLAVSYRNWFLDYASYVILDRAVPHIDDGLKPV